MPELSPAYWNERYEIQNTPWDIGKVSPPIRRYLDTLSDKSLRILVPGAGNAYEAIYAHQQGFHHVFVCDWAAAAFDHLKAIAPDFPAQHLLVEDFFKLELAVDLILEQTFFCAIDPTLRDQYVEKSAALLTEKGKIAGLLFAQPFPDAGPPFGGTKEEYIEYFSPHFHILEMNKSPHSIPPRLGRELFFEMQKR